MAPQGREEREVMSRQRGENEDVVDALVGVITRMTNERDRWRSMHASVTEREQAYLRMWEQGNEQKRLLRDALDAAHDSFVELLSRADGPPGQDPIEGHVRRIAVRERDAIQAVTAAPHIGSQEQGRGRSQRRWCVAAGHDVASDEWECADNCPHPSHDDPDESGQSGSTVGVSE